MEYLLINEAFSFWYATVVLSILTAFSVLVWCGVFFVTTVVYDIYKQVSLKYTKAK